jgi:hypothetical protein
MIKGNGGGEEEELNVYESVEGKTEIQSRSGRDSQTILCHAQFSYSSRDELPKYY